MSDETTTTIAHDAPRPASSKPLIGLLRALAWLTIVGGILTGILTANEQSQLNEFLPNAQKTPAFLLILLYTLAGLIGSILWFALARLLSNQDEIRTLLAGAAIENSTGILFATDTDAAPGPDPTRKDSRASLVVGLIVVFMFAAVAAWLRFGNS